MTAQLLDLSPAEYHKDPCPTPSLSASIAKKLVMECPLKAWLAHPRLGNRPSFPTPDMQFGTVVHHLFSGVPGRIAVIEHDDYRTKAAQQHRDGALARGETPILARKLPEAQKVADSARKCCEQSGEDINLLGKWEQVVLWEEDGVACRGMLDHLQMLECPYILDLKTSSSANPADLGKKIVEDGYDIQMAAYLNAIHALDPSITGHIRPFFLFVETDFPYLASIVRPSEGMLQLGLARWERAKAIWRECLLKNQWPGYSKKVTTVFPTNWQLQQEMEHGTEITAV